MKLLSYTDVIFSDVTASINMVFKKKEMFCACYKEKFAEKIFQKMKPDVQQNIQNIHIAVQFEARLLYA